MGTAKRSADAGPLVGRAPELAALDEALAQVRRTRSGACVAVAGALGLGKSRLLSELEARAAARGDPVFAGRGSEFELGVPYGALVEALDDYLGGLAPDRLSRLGEEQRAELADIFPALADAPRRARPLQAERFRAHRAVRALLESLADRKPVLLVLDDVHWADPETVELIGHLLRQPPAAPVLLAIAYRGQHVAEALPAALERARRDGPCQLLELQPLTVAQAHQLLGNGIVEEARSEFVRESGGNPFFLEQLARAIGPAGSSPPAARPGPVPAAVLAALERELAALDDEQRRLVRGASVVGEPFEVDLAAVAAEVDDATALRGLDGLVVADLVRPTGAPRRFVFRHPLVRRAVYAGAGAGWRLAAHRRVADALRAHGASASVLADHVERSARSGDELAIGTLTEAGDATLARAPGTAAHWFGAALTLVAAGDERRLGLQVRRATALGGAGKLAEACDALSEMLAALPPDAYELRARAVTYLARIHQPLGRQGEARALLERTLAQLPDRHSTAAALLVLALVSDHLLSAEFEAMNARADQALEIGRALGDPLLQAAAWAGVALARQHAGAVSASLDAAARAAAILDGLDDASCAPLLETFWCLATAEDVLERWEDCQRHTDRGLRLARSFGVGFVFMALMHAAPLALGWQGRHGQARAAAAAAVEAAHLSGSDPSLVYAYTVQCFTHAQAGEADAAVRSGERGVGLGRALSPGLFVALPHVNLAAAHLEAGRFERARAQLLEGRARGALAHWVGRCWWELWMARAELGLGRLDVAHDWVRRASATAEEMGLVGRRGAALHARAAVALARGDAVAATADARQACELLGTGGRVSDAARARVLAGRALAAAGERERAVAELQRARATLIECDAPRLADHAAGELRRLGLRVARSGGSTSAQPGLRSLSAREQEIAALAASAHTNKQIAGELHLAESTVENHLSRVFAKLGISSRVALAGAIERERGSQG